jgi:hypothetical protein
MPHFFSAQSRRIGPILIHGTPQSRKIPVLNAPQPPLRPRGVELRLEVRMPVHFQVHDGVPVSYSKRDQLGFTQWQRDVHGCLGKTE